MGLILIYDTETTGLPEYRIPSDDPAQPHLVEISAGLYDLDTGEIADTFYAIIRPDGWQIPPETTAIHGISMERALADGISEANVIDDFLAFHRRADLRIAHNISFDDRIIRIAVKRYKGEEAADAWSEAPSRCTAKMATPILNLPPTPAMLRKNMNFPKTPNLGECLKFFFDEDAGDQAHAATYDREGCARIFFEIRKRQPDHPLMPQPKAPRAPRSSKLAAMESASPPATSDPKPPTDGNEVGFL